MDEVRSVGSVAIFRIEPIRTIAGGIKSQPLKLNIEEIEFKVKVTCSVLTSLPLGGKTNPRIK